MGMSEAYDKLVLTFGIEIEHLFLIKQNEVSSKPKYQWLLPEFCRFSVPSVGEVDLTKNDQEGLVQAAQLLRVKGGEVTVMTKVSQWNQVGDESTDAFSYWRLADDFSVDVPLNAEELDFASDGRILLDNFDDWKFSRLELISPALIAPMVGADEIRPNGLDELKTYLGYLNRPYPPALPYHVVSGPHVGGGHVHLGLQPQGEGQQDLPLDFLQHLAFICLAFEDVIALLHHPERHGYMDSYTWRSVTSNRFVGQGRPQNEIQHHCELGSQFSCEDAFVAIFKAQDHFLLDKVLNTELGVEDDEDRSQDHENIVNFNNVLDAEPGQGKRTIEFRQHHGSLSAEDLCEWVTFITFLARAAERKAKEQPRKNSIPESLTHKIMACGVDIQKQDIAREQALSYTDDLQQETQANMKARKASLHTQLDDERRLLRQGNGQGSSTFVEALEEELTDVYAQQARHLDLIKYKKQLGRRELLLDQPGTLFDQASKYAEIFQEGKKRTLKELFDLIELPIKQRRYWWKRAQKFRGVWAATYKGRGRNTCNDWPPCKLDQARDCEGWGEGELDFPPWDADTDASSIETDVISTDPDTDMTGTKLSIDTALRPEHQRHKEEQDSDSEFDGAIVELSPEEESPGAAQARQRREVFGRMPDFTPKKYVNDGPAIGRPAPRRRERQLSLGFFGPGTGKVFDLRKDPELPEPTSCTCPDCDCRGE